ncbi:MAG: hypothetical protein AB1776_05175 [Bacillota bacterium]
MQHTLAAQQVALADGGVAGPALARAAHVAAFHDALWVAAFLALLGVVTSLVRGGRRAG